MLSAEEKKELLKHLECAIRKAARKEAPEQKQRMMRWTVQNEDENAGNGGAEPGNGSCGNRQELREIVSTEMKLKSVTEGVKASGELEAGVFGAGKSDSGGYAVGQSKLSDKASPGWEVMVKGSSWKGCA